MSVNKKEMNVETTTVISEMNIGKKSCHSADDSASIVGSGISENGSSNSSGGSGGGGGGGGGGGFYSRRGRGPKPAMAPL